MENKGCVLMQKYEVGRLLGQGTFAKVYYAKNVHTAETVAIKTIDKEKVVRFGLMEQIKREVSVMRLAKHPNIVDLREVMATKTKIYFAMEYARGGELFGKVARGRLEEGVARRYFRQLIGAVEFCHGRGVYHRDLKLENLLLDENEDLKVSDFGLSALVDSRRQDGLLHTACGTPAYVAPEVISRKGYDGEKADVWSCGVILYVLLAGYLPFQDSNLMEMYRKISKAEFKCPHWFSPETRRLLSKILNPNPAKRSSIAKIKEHPWFARGDVGKPQGDVPAGEALRAEAKQDDAVKPANMNAFDIISLSAGFDLSGLFVDSADHAREARFTSWKPASVIVSKLEEFAELRGLKVWKKNGGVVKMEGSRGGGRKGASLVIDTEIFEVAPPWHLVEMKKTSGDTVEYQKLLKEDMRPALKDVIWAWQGEVGHMQQQQA